MMSEQITWENITVQLGQLKPWADNPRQSTQAQAKKLLQSWDKFGQVETVAVSPGLDLYNGHQRLSALLTVYGRDYVIEARQASRHLTEDEKRELTITLHAGATGSWDWDSLSNWQPAELQEWGFDDSLLSNWRLDVASLGNFADCEMAWTNAGSAARIFRHRWNGMLKASEQGQRRVHPTQKPVALAYWAFETKGKASDVIYDPFLGSGISLLAAEQFADNRTVYGVDLAPAYIATTIQRMSDAFGITAELIDMI